MSQDPTLLLSVGAIMTLGALSAPAAPPVKLPFALPKADAEAENRYLYGTRVRLVLAAALFEAGEKEAANRQLQAVERKIERTKNGFIFNSGKQVSEEELAGVRDGDGFKFGLRRSGHTGKSWGMSSLARFYFERGDFDQAKRLIREIPSMHTQLDAAGWLVTGLVDAGRLDEAASYRAEVLEAADWNVKRLRIASNLRADKLFTFAKESALAIFEAHRQAAISRTSASNRLRTVDVKAADGIARELAGWIKERNESGLQPDIGCYREIALTLIRYYIDTDRRGKAETVAEACTEKWREYNMALIDPIMVQSFERHREQQLKVYKLALKQPKGGSFPITSGNLTRLPDEVTSRFIEIEQLELSDPAEACNAYFELGREFLADPERCKRYLQQIVQALARLGEETAALKLMATLQENLPQAKIQGCPITSFQLYIDQYTEGLNAATLRDSMRVQEDKLTTPERLWVSGVPLAKLYARAGDSESALRVLDKASAAMDKEDGPYRMQGIITTRRELTGEIRHDEVRKMVEFALFEKKKRPGSKQARLASVARFFVGIGRLDWAETFLDEIAPAA